MVRTPWRAILFVAIALVVIGTFAAFKSPQLFEPQRTDLSAVAVDLEQATVAYVVDGDTIAITRDGHADPERVRLIGIDTPELGHGKGPDECWAAEARDELKALLPEGTEVTLSADPSQPDVDKYGRLLRHIDAGGVNVVRHQLQAGAGPEYTYDAPYAGQAEYRAEEQRARTAGLGSWGACHR
ncbi:MULTISPECIES: thermonuclease family protein [unclassified Leucobacter]|uniref:thermonuclease family protein n=1 Tax=unclassified Leucobacter TaxID=2621730 RepID=UPI0030193B3C